MGVDLANPLPQFIPTEPTSWGLDKMADEDLANLCLAVNTELARRCDMSNRSFPQTILSGGPVHNVTGRADVFVHRMDGGDYLRCDRVAPSKVHPSKELEGHSLHSWKFDTRPGDVVVVQIRRDEHDLVTTNYRRCEYDGILLPITREEAHSICGLGEVVFIEH